MQHARNPARSAVIGSSADALGAAAAKVVEAGKALDQRLEPVIEPVQEKVGEIAFKLLNQGILMTPCGRHGNVFRFMPPLNVSDEQVDEAMDIVAEAVRVASAARVSIRNR